MRPRLLPTNPALTIFANCMIRSWSVCSTVTIGLRGHPSQPEGGGVGWGGDEPTPQTKPTCCSVLIATCSSTPTPRHCSSGPLLSSALQPQAQGSACGQPSRFLLWEPQPAPTYHLSPSLTQPTSSPTPTAGVEKVSGIQQGQGNFDLHSHLCTALPSPPLQSFISAKGSFVLPVAPTEARQANVTSLSHTLDLIHHVSYLLTYPKSNPSHQHHHPPLA